LSYQGGIPPVNIVFQSYHLMVFLYGMLIVWLVISALASRQAKQDKYNKTLLQLMVYGPIIPFVAIQAGWMVAEIGRQPWAVYDLLLTADGVSVVVSALEINITILLFLVFYTILFISWLRVVLGMIKKGPIVEGEVVATGDAESAKGGE